MDCKKKKKKSRICVWSGVGSGVYLADGEFCPLCPFCIQPFKEVLITRCIQATSVSHRAQESLSTHKELLITPWKSWSFCTCASYPLFLLCWPPSIFAQATEISHLLSPKISQAKCDVSWELPQALRESFITLHHPFPYLSKLKAPWEQEEGLVKFSISYM